ncbi:BbrUII/HgiDII family restriction enzyme [Ursidibacter sp. B-7004-1]
MPKFNIDLNVLNHLGLSLYTNTPAVLTEIVSNSWDADATEVHIDIDTENSIITISDNGHGMDSDDIEKKFLNVGYARRRDNRQKTPLFGRDVMGRKGIGKLAMFSLANEVSIFTKMESKDIVALKVDVSDLKQAIENKQEYHTQAIEDVSCFSKEHGTTILLSDIDRKINTTATYLKKHLSRRFSILGDKNNFKVFVNNEEITLEHRGYTSKIEFLWSFGQSAEYLKKSEKRYKELADEIVFDGATYKISGFIASVAKPSELKDDDVSNNAITILSNGRIFQENILNELDNAKHFASYLVGEINANFLDLTNHQDMAISSRQGLIQNDDRYLILKNFLARALREVDKDWDEWRREEGLKDIKENHPVLENWLNGLSDNRDKKAAEKLLSSVNTMSFSGSELEQEETRKDVLKHTVLAFEKLKVRGNLERLSELSSFNVDAFKPILKSIDDIEESYFYDVTRQRLGIIEKFEALTCDNEKEKVIQKYLYEHLWLLDPSWERTTAETEIERTLTKELKEIEPESSGARIDIAYKTISGKYIIIEMKRPEVKTPFDDLITQGKKYIKATHQWYIKNPSQMQNGKAPIIEVYFIIGAKGQEKVNEDIEYNAQYVATNYVVDQLRSINGRIFTYNDLITQSRQTYSEYINSQKDIQKIKELIDSI